MHDGTVAGEIRWGEPKPAKAFTSHHAGGKAPGVGGWFIDSQGNEFSGGFGGGGSAASYAAGGAGGYSGGGGGPDEGYSGGGGSFANARKGRSLMVGVNNDGDGIVHIEYLGASTNLQKSTTPIPGPTQPTQPNNDILNTNNNNNINP